MINENIYREWRRLGIGFTESPIDRAVDIERLFVATSEQGRGDSRLISGMVAWLIHYGDLVCVRRLSEIMKPGNLAVMGGVIELVLARGGDERLLKVLARCKPLSVPEFMFPHLAQTGVEREYEKENAMPEFRKWGLFCSNLGSMEDAVFKRERVLRENMNIALRAVFGPTAKADIFACLLDRAKISIRQLSLTLGYSYKPVYLEVQRMMQNGLVLADSSVRRVDVSLTAEMREFFLGIPFAQ